MCRREADNNVDGDDNAEVESRLVAQGTGAVRRLKPRASPATMSVAAPVLQQSATSCRQPKTSLSAIHLTQLLELGHVLKVVTQLLDWDMF